MSKVRLVFCLLFLPVSTLMCYSQDFQYKSIDKNYYSHFMNPAINDFMEVKDYLPKNPVKDGSVDYTVYVQKAIDENLNLRFPNFPIRINDSGLKLRSNSNLFFDQQSELYLNPTKKGNYSMLLLKKIKNVNIYNPTLIGDREKHLAQDGEWGMGIRIDDSQNVKIYNSNIKNTWGDGIYITSFSSLKKTNGVLIKYGSIDNVRRNGISLISGANITVDSVQISNVNGHNPASGIDVEPNEKGNVIQKVTFNNIYTFNNERDGIVLSLNNLINNEKSSEVSIAITNHKDEGSRLGLRIPNIPSTKKRGKRLTGEIIIENAVWLNTQAKRPLNIRENTVQLPDVTFKNIQTNNMSDGDLKKSIKAMIKNKKQFRLIED